MIKIKTSFFLPFFRKNKTSIMCNWPDNNDNDHNNKFSMRKAKETRKKREEGKKNYVPLNISKHCEL